MRTDIENIENGTRIKLFPNANNPLHNKPVEATFQSGYFYCAGSNAADGPDYYWNDVFQYNDGFEVL